MMASIYQFNVSRDGLWLKSKMPYNLSEQTCGFVAIDSNGKQIGAVVYDNFMHSTAQVSLVLDSVSAIKCGLLECASEWYWSDANKNSLLALVADVNERSLRLVKRVGFREIHRIKNGHAYGVDTLIFECKHRDFNLKSRKMRRLKDGLESN